MLMKKMLLATGLILILMNSTIGLIYQDYTISKMLLGDFSILLTFVLLFISSGLPTPDAYKIGYAGIISFSGLIRFICAVMTGPLIINNWPPLLFIIVFGIECILLMIIYAMRNK